MGKKAAEIGSQFTVALGDNFYSFGVQNVDDPRFKETYEVYTYVHGYSPLHPFTIETRVVAWVLSSLQ